MAAPGETPDCKIPEIQRAYDSALVSTASLHHPGVRILPTYRPGIQVDRHRLVYTLPHLVGSQKHTGTMPQDVGSSNDLRPPQFTVQGQFDGETPTHRPPRHNAVGRMIGIARWMRKRRGAWMDLASKGTVHVRGSWQWGQMTILTFPNLDVHSSLRMSQRNHAFIAKSASTITL